MKRMHQLATTMVFATLVTLISSTGSAQSWGYTNDDVAKFPKAVYDINVTTAVTLRNFLWVIDGTYDLMISKGVPAKKIKFAISLRGASVNFVTKDFSEADPADGSDLGVQIRGFIDSLASKGVRIEACDISLAWMGVPAETLVDEIVVIDNALASTIWYQRRGFALFPITELP